MAISDVTDYAHLTEADVEALCGEFDAIRRDIEASLGEDDARYIRDAIRLQRFLETGGRAVLFASWFPPAWVGGTALLGTAKIVENMELGHNVMHGQWDWMNDPEIHSSSWEWDIAGVSAHWKQTHNYIHHKYTNVLGLDDDVGYGLLRVTRDQRWQPWSVGNPVYNLLLQLFFEYGVALQHLELGKVTKGGIDRVEFVRIGARSRISRGRSDPSQRCRAESVRGGRRYAISEVVAGLGQRWLRPVWVRTAVRGDLDLCP